MARPQSLLAATKDAIQQAILGLVVIFFCALDGVLGICDVSRCTEAGNCVLSPYKRSCKCAVGYYGDLCDQVATIKVVCGKDHITIRVSEDLFKYYNVVLESLHLANKSCGAHKEVIADITYYMVRTPKNRYVACGGKPLEKNITHMAYSLTLVSDLQAYENIVRDPTVKIEYKCVYPYIRTVSLPFPIRPFSSDATVRVDELDARVELALFPDDTYAEAFSAAPTIHLRDKAYVQVRVAEPEDFFLLRVNRCWVTQTPEPNGTTGVTHTLLHDGCASDETVTFLSGTVEQTGSNGESSTVRYSFNMFRFVMEPHSFYLHCTVRLCTPDDGDSCVPECKSIKKRAAVMGDPNYSLLSYGPIRIDVTDSPKSNLLLMLVLPVGVIWGLGFFLLILIAVSKAGKRRLSRLSNS